MLAYGTPVEYNKFSKREVFIPVKNKSGGWIGVFRIVLVGLEVLVSFIPGVGAGLSAAIGLGFASSQAALTGISYAEGNIRGTGNLFTALAVDLLPGLTFGASAAFKTLRTETIVVETVDRALETTRLNRVFVKGTKEFKENLKVLKSEGVRTTTSINKIDGSLTRVSKLRAAETSKYRSAYLREQIKLGRETADIAFDDFDVQVNTIIENMLNEDGYYYNKDRALLRRINNAKNFLSSNPEGFERLISSSLEGLSPEMKAVLTNLGDGNIRNSINTLVQYTESQKLTSRINRIFASGESDWASKEFWRQVKSGKILKSSNFYTQAAQALNANDVGRELITKPFNALIRQNKKLMKKYQERFINKWLKKYAARSAEEIRLEGEIDREIETVFRKITKKSKGRDGEYRRKLAKKLTKGTKYAEKIKREIERSGGHYAGGSLVMGWRILQDLGKVKQVQVYFNKMNTNALTPGSKNKGGKKDIIMPLTEHQLKMWKHSGSESSYYLSHFAISRGGRPLGFEVKSGIFSNFLSFVPLPALRNILSVVSNTKTVIKDMVKGEYFNNWIKEFSQTIKRLWVHKVGKLAGSTLGIFGKGIGKEGQRLGLGIAKGFQHSGGQRLGSFSVRGLIKETAPTAFKGTALRKGQRRVGTGKLKTNAQAKLSAGRYLTNIRRIGGIPKI